MEYLELEFDPDSLEAFGQTHLGGRLGDKAGVARYSGLSLEPLTKWKRSIRNPLRKAWCRRYLTWLGPERLLSMGYDSRRLRSELDSIEVGWDGLAADSLAVTSTAARSALRRRTRPNAAPTIATGTNGQLSTSGAGVKGGVT